MVGGWASEASLTSSQGDTCFACELAASFNRKGILLNRNI
jgi:hypothetical protein